MKRNTWQITSSRSGGCVRRGRLQNKRGSVCQGPLLSFIPFALMFNSSSSPKTVCVVVLAKRLKFLETHVIQNTVVRHPRRHFESVGKCALLLAVLRTHSGSTSFPSSCCLILSSCHCLPGTFSNLLMSVCTFSHLLLPFLWVLPSPPPALFNDDSET